MATSLNQLRIVHELFPGEDEKVQDSSSATSCKCGSNRTIQGIRREAERIKRRAKKDDTYTPMILPKQIRGGTILSMVEVCADCGSVYSPRFKDHLKDAEDYLAELQRSYPLDGLAEASDG